MTREELYRHKTGDYLIIERKNGSLAILKIGRIRATSYHIVYSGFDRCEVLRAGRMKIALSGHPKGYAPLDRVMDPTPALVTQWARQQIIRLDAKKAAVFELAAETTAPR